MIVPMAKVRVLGPREQLDAALRVIQNVGRLQLAEVDKTPGVRAARLDARGIRRERQLASVLSDIDGALRELGAPVSDTPVPQTATVADFARWARLASRVRTQAATLRGREAALGDERAVIARYKDFLDAVLPGVRKVADSPRLTSHAVVVPAAARASIEPLAAALRSRLGAEFSMSAHDLPGGDVAILLVLPKEFSGQLEERLADARVPEVPLPESYAHLPLEDAMPRMLGRLADIPAEVDAARHARSALADSATPELLTARAAIIDQGAAANAHEQSAVTAHAFTIEGWLPERDVPELERRIQAAAGPAVIVERIAREQWGRDDVPVVLSNPRLFRPFEALIALLPLPRYGSIDPTPFVAVFFPLMFGMMLGDVGYGAILAGTAIVVHRRAKPGSLAYKAAEIAGPCAAFAIIFGVLFGEYFGDLGGRAFGLRAIAFDREKAILATLAASVGLGVAHVVLGLVLGAVTAAAHDTKRAIGQGTSAIMVVLVIASLLAAFNVLPARFFSPAVIALLVAFPILIFTEGLIAPVEFLATLGNVLSYARIMAIGTASVILAVIANQMVGAVGSTAVGLLFALLFHMVNFAIGLFSPAIQSLRLQYVEFFGKFYSPGGRPYEPFGHRVPDPAPTSTRSPS
jgi:V/A-type H+-transporting ATPase subunit I